MTLSTLYSGGNGTGQLQERKKTDALRQAIVAPYVYVCPCEKDMLISLAYLYLSPGNGFPDLFYELWIKTEMTQSEIRKEKTLNLTGERRNE